MKKTINWMLTALLVVGLGMNLTSCKEDELTEEEKQQQAEQAQAEALEWWDVVSQLTDAQAMPDDWKTATFEPVIGTVSESDPYTRVIATNDLATAAQRFAYLTGKSLDETTAECTWSHKDAGSLTYHAGSASGTYLAQVDVNLKQMPKLKKILYQTPEQMGENASGSFSGTAYYRFGDVVKKKNGNGNYDYWVCVRPAFSLERKGDSHWITLNPLPDENIYSYTYKNFDWDLPTKLGESKEHMQNFAEMLYAILDPQQYFANLGSDTKMKVFHDFSRTDHGKYHNQYFWERVCHAWERQGLFEYMFNKFSKDKIAEIVKSEGLNFIYKGYSWWPLSWNCSLYHANYSGTNLKTATYTSPTKNMENVLFLVKLFYNFPESNHAFFGDDNHRFIVRYATGEKLSKDANGKGNYSVKSALSNCEDVYVYNKYYYQNEPNGMYDLNKEPEETAPDNNNKTRGFFAPGTVIRDERGNRWVCYASWCDTDIAKSPSHTSFFFSFDAVESVKQAVTSTDATIKHGDFAKNLVTEDEVFKLGIALRGAAFPASEADRQLAASMRQHLGIDPLDLVARRDSMVTTKVETARADIISMNLAFTPNDDIPSGCQPIMRYVTDCTRIAGNRADIKEDNYRYHYLYDNYYNKTFIGIGENIEHAIPLDATHGFYWKGRTYRNRLDEDMTIDNFEVPYDRWSHCKWYGTDRRDGNFTSKDYYNEAYDWRKFNPGASPRRYSTWFEPITFVATLQIDDDDRTFFQGVYGGKKYTLVTDPMTEIYKDQNFQFWYEMTEVNLPYTFTNDQQADF